MLRPSISVCGSTDTALQHNSKLIIARFSSENAIACNPNTVDSLPGRDTAPFSNVKLRREEVRLVRRAHRGQRLVHETHET
ncbi:hypothetical protein PHJA_001560200 [Phtheirospermum japonicum]|uniref:Uncharacterized protein n=1 Tax=Phtheirospermum japonicum TaxID=374723 RepID=A0A830C0U3_9LAMI|nr:hypothetical protein PHJA_001560200 [Phtheirospermum japonicum]